MSGIFLAPTIGHIGHGTQLQILPILISALGQADAEILLQLRRAQLPRQGIGPDLLTDGRELDAKCVGADVISDLAVLRVNADRLIPAEFGDSNALRVGDEVVAIGDPLGVELRGTMTNGIISGINRDIKAGNRTLTLMQTTAALNTGNSGGPLVNCYGQVVGINTMKIGDYASENGVEGLGFAIPITAVQSVLDKAQDPGAILDPSLGLVPAEDA